MYTYPEIAILLVDIYSKEMKTYIPTGAYMNVHTSSFI